jgi:hypothetical protein
VALDVFDRHRLAAQVEDARRFAGGRADAAGHLGKVVGRKESLARFVVATLVDKVIELGDQVSKGAPLVAERDPAIHAARGLRLERLARRLNHKFVVIFQTLNDRKNL